MGKECSACGAILPDGATVCPFCGMLADSADGKKKKSGVPVGLIVFLSITLALVFAGYVAVTWLRCGNVFDLMGTNGALLRYASVAKDLVDVEEINKNQIVRMLKKVAPRKYLEEVSDDWKDDAKELVEENEDEINDAIKDLRKDSEFDDAIKSIKSLKAKVVRVERLPRSDDAYDEFEDDYGFKADVIAEALGSVELEYDGDTISTLVSIPVIKVGGKWYYGDLPPVEYLRDVIDDYT